MSTESSIFVVCFTGNTGLTDYSVSLCRDLQTKAPVRLITAKSFDAKKYAADFPFDTLFRRTRHYLFDICKFAVSMFNEKPRLLVFQSWLKVPVLDAIVVRLLGLFGIPSIITIHDLLPHYPRPWSRVEMRFFYRSFKGTVVHSMRQQEGLRALGVDVPTLVVPHGVYDIFNTRRLTRAEAHAEIPELIGNRFIALFFGFLGERKGIVEFLEAASLLRDDPRFLFIVAGQPEPKPAILSALESARNGGNVLVHDFSIPHDEVQRYFAACDVVVLPYTEGTTSGVLKLAMAFGKPILCTDIGDFPEALEVWSGLALDRHRLVDDLVLKLGEALANRQTLDEKTLRLGDELRWDHISSRYYAFVESLGMRT